MSALPWIILFLPALAAALITFFTQHDRRLSAGLSIGAVVAGFVLSIIFIASSGWGPMPESIANWLSIGELHVDFGLRLDSLSLLMMLLVTGVASVIHIYSWGYMRDDTGFSRYFACLSLFTFSMLMSASRKCAYGFLSALRRSLTATCQPTYSGAPVLSMYARIHGANAPPAPMPRLRPPASPHCALPSLCFSQAIALLRIDS